MFSGFLSRTPAVLSYRFFLCGGIIWSWSKLHTQRPYGTPPNLWMLTAEHARVMIPALSEYVCSISGSTLKAISSLSGKQWKDGVNNCQGGGKHDGRHEGFLLSSQISKGMRKKAFGGPSEDLFIRSVSWTKLILDPWHFLSSTDRSGLPVVHSMGCKIYEGQH